MRRLPRPRNTAPRGGPSGAGLWKRGAATERGGNNIGRITTTGVISEFPFPTPGSGPWDITAGPDGALWFTENSGSKIGRISTAGVFCEFPTPTRDGPWDITAGPDGALWFTEGGVGKIGRLAP